mgnify:CR=1 FL=1
MATMEPLRNFYGQIIGFTREDSKGDVWIYDINMLALGKYDVRRDVTCNFTGQVVGKGNVLTTLLR